MSSSADKRVVLVTGANKGIGYEAVKLLAHSLPQATILLGTRSVDNGDKAVQRMKVEHSKAGQQHAFDNVHVLELDVTSKQSIDKAVEHVKAQYSKLDVLLCNAGVSGYSGESIETIFAVNIVGVHDMIEAFLPVIPGDGLIDVVSSSVGCWATAVMPPAIQQRLLAPSTYDWPLTQQYMADWLRKEHGQAHEQPWPPTSDIPYGAYSLSKGFLTAYLRSFAASHAQPKLVITCPGYCATDLNKHQGSRPASEGGASVVWPILHQQEAQSGLLYQDAKVHPWVMEVPDYLKKGADKSAEDKAQ